MAWESLTFTIGQILTSPEMNKVQENARQARINHYGSVTPANLEAGVMWWDTQGTYPTLKLFQGSQWVPILFFDPSQNECGIAPNGDGWGTLPMVGPDGERTDYTGPLYHPKNMLLNGAMTYWQRGNSYSVKSFRGYTSDRWMLDIRGSFTVAVRQSSENPLSSPSRWSLQMTITNPQVTLNSGNLLQLVQPVEGMMLARTLYGTSEARPTRLGCYLWSSVTGRFTFSIQNASRTSAINSVINYSVANVWRFCQVGHVGPVGSNWTNDTGVGAWVGVTFAAHDGFRATTPGAWQYGATDFRSVSGQLQGASALNTVFRITDLQYELGEISTPFDSLAPATEIALIRRYYSKTFALDDAPRHGSENFESALGTISESGAHCMITWQYPGMRAKPTIAYYCPGSHMAEAWWDRSIHFAGRFALTYENGPDSLVITTANNFATGNIGSHAQNRHLIHATADAELY